MCSNVFHVEKQIPISKSVFKCFVPTLNRVCITKQSGNETELRAYEQLKNVPFIVEFVGVNDDGFLILEHAGDNLLEILKKRPKFQTLINLFHKVSNSLFRALRACHFLKIIHNDVKPANIMIDRARNVKLCDFDLCFFGERSNYTVGSPAFFCPVKHKAYYCKSLTSEESYSYETDIWSAGVTLWSMWHEGFSFVNCKSPNIIIPPNRKIPHKYNNIIMKILVGNCHTAQQALRLLYRRVDRDDE